MNAVKTNELQVGNYAAHTSDLPNCGGIQIDRQGYIQRVEATDMWGTHSDTHTTLWFEVKGDVKVITVHNDHTWLVRTL